MELLIKKLHSQDMDKFMDLISLFEQVFEMKNFEMPDKSYLQQLLQKEDFFVVTAALNDKVIGGLTCYILHQYYTKAPLVYIYDLAVKNEYHRQGIGKKLITTLIHYCKKEGIEEIFVQADEEDIHAVEFYHSAGGIPEKVIHFNYPLQK